MNTALIRNVFLSRRKTWLLLAVLAVTNVCLFGYLEYFQRPKLIALQNDWHAKRQAANSSKLVDVAEIYAQGTRDLETWRKKILPKRDFPKVLGELYALSSSNNLTLKGMSYKPDLLKDEDLLEYNITFSVSGRYAAIKSLVSDLIRSDHILTVDSISLSNGNATEESVTLKIQLTSYFIPEEA